MNSIEIVLMYDGREWGFFQRKQGRKNKRLRGGGEEFYKTYQISMDQKERLIHGLRRHIQTLKDNETLPSKNNYPFTFPELTTLLEDHEITKVC